MTTPSDIMRQAINYQLRGVNTSIPAEIVKYDYTKQKADVQPLLRKKYKDGTVESLPIITNVPVVFPKGGAFSMHWPLSVGDSMLLVFAQRSLDEWLIDGGEVTPQDPRMMDLSDAIAIPGLMPFSPASSAPDNDNFNLEIGSARMRISPSGQFCFHGLTDELIDLIQQIVGEMQTFVGANGGGPVVLDPAYVISLGLLQSKIIAMRGTC